MKALNEDIERHCDVVILGAGIAGLWTLHCLAALGLSVVVLESHAIGGGQTIKSQGIVHGGLKYALTGILSAASEAMARMPQVWQACLDGQGAVDLRGVRKLSDAQLLWSTGGLRSGLINFFASKALRSRVQRVVTADLPMAFQSPQFKGAVYRLNESVLDVPSVLQALAQPFRERILAVEGPQGVELEYDVSNKTSDTPNIKAVRCRHQGRTLRLHASHVVFTAGSGNQMLSSFPAVTKTQERPLHMVWCKFQPAMSPALYGHCMDDAMQPRITITTHRAQDGRTVWYLGGRVAETGVERDEQTQKAHAKAECQALFPWINFEQADWGTVRVNRAEPAQPDGQKPESAQVEQHGNAIVAWPTKLALAPVMAEKVRQRIAPDGQALKQASPFLLTAEDWPRAAMAVPPWDE